MGLPGATELFVILGIVVLVFGGKKIPELMKGVGSGIKNFKKAIKDEDVEVADASVIEKVETSAKAESKTKPEETVKQA